MIKKYSVLVGLVFMLGIVGCQQTQNTTGNSSEERLEDKSMEEQLISKEFLMEQCRITEEELEGIDADAFIEKYGLTESTIKKVKIPVILEDYRQEMQEENLEDEISEGTTGWFHWRLFLEMEDGRVFDYSGSGAAGDSTPETYNLFTEKLHDMIEE